MIKHVILGLMLTMFSVNAIAETVAANSDVIRYVGRVEHQSDGSVRYDWVGTYLEVGFIGDGISAVLSEEGTSFHNVIIDGKVQCKIKIEGKTAQTYSLAKGLGKGKHVLRLQKCTEGEFGCTTVHSIEPSRGGKLFATEPRKRLIEVIGDSYTCGYGTESLSADEHFSLDTENCNKAYGCIVARYFDADYVLVAHSGQGIVRHYGDSVQESADNMPKRWQRLFDAHGKRKYDFKAYRPDLVMIMLGENDFSPTAIPTEEQYVGGYVKLIENIKANYGEVPVLCIAPHAANLYLRAAVARLGERTAGMKGVTIAHSLLGVVKHPHDLGADWHPNYQGQCKIAMSLIPQISYITGWQLPNLF